MAKRKRGPKKSEPTPAVRPLEEAQTQEVENQPSNSGVSGTNTGQTQPLVITDPQPSTSQTPESRPTPQQNTSCSTKIEKPTGGFFPKRPGFLTIGTPVQLLANHFLLSVGQKKAYHYDIQIESAFKPLERDPNVVDKNVEETNVKEKKKNQYTKKLATSLNRKIFQKMVDLYSINDNPVFRGINPVFDGQKNMFTSKKLKATENKAILILKVSLTDVGRNSTFNVRIKLAESNEEIDLNILNKYHSGKTCDDEVLKKSVLFINTLLRHNSSMSWVPIGQSIHNPETPGQKLGRYLLLSYGYYSSVRNLMVGPTLNIDRSAAAFYDPLLRIEEIICFIIRGNLREIPAKALFDNKRKITRELSGLQIEARHILYGTTYRKYRILGLTRQSAKEIKFNWIENNSEGQVNRGKVSVQDYFRRKYGIKLEYPDFPCLEVGNINNKVNLPLEVCRLVPNQRLRRSMTNNERSQMTRSSGQQQPNQRLKMCEDFVYKQFHSGPLALKNRPFLSEFGIDVAKNLLTVNSKVIEPPALKYGPQDSVRPKNGEWDMYKTKARFLKAERLENWIIINMSFNESFTENDIKKFHKELCDQAIEMGMYATHPHRIIRISNYKPKVTFNKIKSELKSKSKLKMILFVTPDKSHQYSDDIYSEIKLLGDVQISGGLPTQCVNINSIWDYNRGRKWNRSYLRQLMLKVNPKLGGINVALLDNQSMPQILKNKSLMIVGADVNHPAPADKISPSIAALVGSYDHQFCNYYTTVSMQPKSREEMIRSLDEMMFELLTNYQKKQKSLPNTIIFYRDGVSEGQFQHLIDNEYQLLMKAFSKIDVKYKPKLTFIVVQKRHHTRFMTAKDKGNVPPGTVVEEGITHKRDFDFYLCSHAGKIGTSRSAHYYVLADDNRFTSDDMCKMTYYLCHIYQRCTKSVSIPAPVYYADLAAYRAKVHASFHPNSSDVTSVTSVTSEEDGEETLIRNFKDVIKVSDAQKEKLYFC